MPLLNYTTSISSDKTVAEICALLGSAKCAAVMQEYDLQGSVSAIAFKINTEHGIICYHLPCFPDAIVEVFNRQVVAGKLARRYKGDKDQARRVGWRIVKDWLEAQLAIIETGMVKLDQVFLPYAQGPDGRTLYEIATSHGGILALCDKNGQQP